ncbi:hypothetical protein FISHEDRAFT_69585 [Fistulina hepatica ATCC 64428]|uniref:Uncharacterized protein n=1 Tax=Fistulina hepatica ATCC 64428 TaxID=1128425 RepID=A0A0D7AM05_9AGAR|nr:hypothetical protein FISHEDRAFT_69585 [Fistulina hepatica ATCC 64428]
MDMTGTEDGAEFGFYQPRFPPQPASQYSGTRNTDSYGHSPRPSTESEGPSSQEFEDNGTQLPERESVDVDQASHSPMSPAQFVDWLANAFKLTQESHVDLIDFERLVRVANEPPEKALPALFLFTRVISLLDERLNKKALADVTNNVIRQAVFDVSRTDFSNRSIRATAKKALENEQNINSMAIVFNKNNLQLQQEWSKYLSRRISVTKASIRTMILETVVQGEQYFGGLGNTIDRYLVITHTTADIMTPQHICQLLYLRHFGRKYAKLLTGNQDAGVHTAKWPRLDGANGVGVADGISEDEESEGNLSEQSNANIDNSRKRKRTVTKDPWLDKLSVEYTQKTKEFSTMKMMESKHWRSYLSQLINTERRLFPDDPLSHVLEALLNATNCQQSAPSRTTTPAHAGRSSPNQASSPSSSGHIPAGFLSRTPSYGNMNNVVGPAQHVNNSGHQAPPSWNHGSYHGSADSPLSSFPPAGSLVPHHSSSSMGLRGPSISSGATVPLGEFHGSPTPPTARSGMTVEHPSSTVPGGYNGFAARGSPVPHAFGSDIPPISSGQQQLPPISHSMDLRSKHPMLSLFSIRSSSFQQTTPENNER